ncbi:SLATT domain-containing protein [Pseudidiomarina donghaiensis]|jgi:hypothetical protein|uniref:SLATT domain-containing protein n=1 Tax=Pseudidiomarina donghaiensis TaxID=519452 RepID=UPI003A97E457
MKTHANCSYRKLYTTIKAAYQTRFYAARSLRRQSQWSNITLVIMSLGLILISLMQAYELGKNIDSNFVTLAQAFMAIVILVYSVAANSNNVSLIADRLYSSASELTSLSKRLIPLIDTTFTKATYDNLCKDYDAILKRYESQSVYDSEIDYLRATLRMPEVYNYKFIDKTKIHTRILADCVAKFGVYCATFIVLIAILYWIAFGL